MNDSDKNAEGVIMCPSCESTRWTCWDERIHRYRSEEEGFEIEMPVGYLRCLNCDYHYLNHEPSTHGLTELTD